MMKLLEQLVQKYDAASVFVVAATLVVVIELMVMRVLVPVASNTENQETDALMAQVYGDTSQAETMKEIEAWQHEALILTQRLPNTSELWQKDLESIHAFGTEQVEMATTPKASNEKGKQSEAMEYAASKLILQSVMSGRTPLANINGKIYRVGDTVVLRDGDIFKLHNLSTTLVEKIRSGGGPQFIEAYTYRWIEHVGPDEDWHLKYRSKEEAKQWKQDDQVVRLANLLPTKIRQKIEKEVGEETAKAIEFAIRSPFPDDKELYKHVYK